MFYTVLCLRNFSLNPIFQSRLHLFFDAAERTTFVMQYSTVCCIIASSFFFYSYILMSVKFMIVRYGIWSYTTCRLHCVSISRQHFLKLQHIVEYLNRSIRYSKFVLLTVCSEVTSTDTLRNYLFGHVQNRLTDLYTYKYSSAMATMLSYLFRPHCFRYQ